MLYEYGPQGHTLLIFSIRPSTLVKHNICSRVQVIENIGYLFMYVLFYMVKLRPLVVSSSTHPSIQVNSKVKVNSCRNNQQFIKRCIAKEE